jgi:GDP-L-galactose phosphorylase
VGDSLEEMAALVGQACERMQARNIPHNLLISDNGTRVFIFPQCYAEKQARGLVPQELLDTGVNPACWEIAGARCSCWGAR